ncbi:hypothetical protein GpartN1_g6446.t1 [Galdieria partita]|uniref:Ribophorin II n=1 Tax=Galdieria partita TaxID=83374 RepID=A0A9C7Q2F1_9RHOD|nr:hypothetical protein GpartN1_g6446.t1 [Galdieria partita]
MGSLSRWLWWCCLFQFGCCVIATETEFVLQRVEISHTHDKQTLFHKQVVTSDSLPVKLPFSLEDDHQLAILVELNTGSSVGIEDLEQVWISFVEKSTKREYLFLPCKRSKGSLLFEVKLDASVIESFEGRQGDFLVKLVVGDHRVSRAIHQLLIDSITLSYRAKNTPRPKGIFDFDISWKFYPQEEIEHLFQPPTKRAPIFLSFLFTGLVILPFLVYLFWILTTCNIFPLQMPTDPLSIVWFVVFHMSLASFVYCLVKFWLSWNILKTWKVMLAIFPVTWISGVKWMQLLSQHGASQDAQLSKKA